MNHGEQVWRLMQGEELLAELIVTGGTSHGRTPGYGRCLGSRRSGRCLRKLRALGHIDDDVGSWQAAYDRIRGAVSLHNPDGRPVPEFLCTSMAMMPWWRWGDESFTQAEVET